MLDPLKSANDAVQAEGPKVLGLFARPVPLWALGVALLAGALLARLA